MSKTIPQDTDQDKIKDPYLLRALKHLETPDNQPWTQDTRFVSAGRFQMIHYPHIMIAPNELASVIRIFEESLPDPKLWRRVFETVETTLISYILDKKPINRINPYVWLTGWALSTVLETAAKEQRLKKQLGTDKPQPPRPKLLNPRARK